MNLSRTKPILTIGALTFTLLASSTPATAAKLSFLICQPGGPDLKDQEQAIMRDFYGYIGKKLGFKQGQIQGQYLTNRKKCLKALEEKPSVLMLSLDLFLDAYKTKRLEPIAQIKIRGKTKSAYYLMSSAGGPSKLEELRGKKISGTTVHDPRFVANVIMKGQLGSVEELALKPKKLGLRGVRDVIRGKSSAVLLDEPQYQALSGTPFEKKLQLVYQSDALTNPPIAVDKQRVKKPLRKKMRSLMLSMSTEDRGKKLLSAFGIDAFVQPSASSWKAMSQQMK